MQLIYRDLKDGLLRPFDFSSELQPSAYTLVVCALVFCFVSLEVSMEFSDASRSFHFDLSFGPGFQISEGASQLSIIFVILWVWAQIHVFFCFLSASFRHFPISKSGKLKMLLATIASILLISVFIMLGAYYLSASAQINLIKPASMIVAGGYYLLRIRRRYTNVES